MKETKCPHCGKDINEPREDINEPRKTLKYAMMSCMMRGDWNAEAPNEFDDFWALVPRKIGKRQARVEWIKLIRDRVQPEEIIAALPEYRAKEDAREKALGPAFQAHAPFRWLRDRRFEDEPAPAPVPKEATVWELRQQEKAVLGQLAKIKRNNQVSDGHRERLTERGHTLSTPLWKKLEKLEKKLIGQIDK